MTSMPTTFELVLTGGPDPHEFTAFVPNGDGGRAAEHSFAWRTDSTELSRILGALARAAISGHPPDDKLHVTFGQRLFDTAFAGPVGELWAERLAQLRPHRRVQRLVVRVDPKSARPLLNLPWEYLHDDHDFLALNWRTPVSRLPWGMPSESLPPLTEPLRLLVVVASPRGLSQNQVLHNRREEDLILGALAGARRVGQVEVEFAPNGALETLDAYLRDYDPHLLHLVGHGVFDRVADSGYLLMETRDGDKREVGNADFAQLLERQARSLRMVFLSACQTAVAARNEGFADLGPRLLRAGVPGVLAMQISVLNRSAMDFGGAFYEGVAGGDPLDAALTEARCKLAGEGLNTVDFATPVLFLSDPDCLQVDEAALAEARPRGPLDLTGVTRAQQFVGRGAELRTLQTNLDPERGRWRAAVVHGLGGMGKTVLAARLAERMAARFDGVKSVRMTPATTAQGVLDQLAAFLLVGNARWNHPLVAGFVGVKDEAVPLESKAAALIEVLRSLRLLLILDNYEDVLPGGQAVSRAVEEAEEADDTPEAGEAAPGLDPDLEKLVALLVGGVEGPSRFLFTSRVSFSPLEAGRLAGAVGHLALGEMGFRDAVYLMETLPPLDALPVAVVPEVRPDLPPQPAALSKRDLYERLGGHPYTVGLFAEHARRSSVEEVLADLAGVRQEMLEFTLLERAVGALPERAGQLLRRAAVYDEPVAVEGLAFMLGDEQDAMPPAGGEVAALEGWGLVARVPGGQEYAVHSLVRDWARGEMGGEEQRGLHRRAAGYWQSAGRDSGDLGDWLRARHYLFLAGEYEAADEIVQMATEYLLRWGQIELLVRLLGESVRTVEGNRRAVALGNLATVYQGLGEYTAARRLHEQVLAEFEALDDRRNVAAALHQLGILHQLQGEYGPARERYEQSLAILEELGDRAGLATSLHQLGNLHYLQGEYGPARERYEQSLAIEEELGNRAGLASSLHQLGMLHQAQGEYGPARERYEQSLAIKEELGDRAGLATSLHQLGMLHQLQGEYGPARERYEQSLAIEEELGNRAGRASSLSQLGILHQLQGEYRPARKLQEQSLVIRQEIGDRSGMAICLHQLGMLHQLQGEYGPARQRYEQSLAIKEELGDRAGLATSLAQMGLLLEREGQLGQAVGRLVTALALFEELGAPQYQQARQVLARLREKMGDEAFEAALQAAGADNAGAAGQSGPASQGMTLEQVVQVAVANTVAVLTQVPEKQEEWWGALGQLQGQVQAAGHADLAAFLGLLRQLVEGASPEHLDAKVPPDLRPAWEAIVRQLPPQGD